MAKYPKRPLRGSNSKKRGIGYHVFNVFDLRRHKMQWCELCHEKRATVMILVNNEEPMEVCEDCKAYAEGSCGQPVWEEDSEDYDYGRSQEDTQ